MGRTFYRRMLPLTLASPWLDPSQWTHDDAVDIREWATAIGTVGAVVTALWLARQQDRARAYRRPVLSLVWSHIMGLTIEEVTYLTGNAAIGKGNAAYLRFNVSNERGKDAAEDVEILVWRVSKAPDKPSGWGRLTNISFPALAWTHAASTRLTIPPGVVRTVDVARAYESPPNAEMRNVLELAIDPAPADGRHRLGPGTYDIEFTLSARNADAQTYWTRVSFDPSGQLVDWIGIESPPAIGGSPLAYE